MACDHKFLGSNTCAKCGWEVPRRRVRDVEPRVHAPLPTLSECLSVCRSLPTSPAEQLQALDLWLRRRGDATVSVGVLAVGDSGEPERRCSVMAHGKTFVATRRGESYDTSWRAICAALGACEQFEHATFGSVG